MTCSRSDSSHFMMFTKIPNELYSCSVMSDTHTLLLCLDTAQGEVALREVQRSDRDAAAAERLGIKQAELDEAERRLSVHRAALEAEMVEALAAASAGFESDVATIQKRAAAVEAHCSADAKKVEAEAAAMREVLQAAQAELDKEKAERLREQSNAAAALEQMKVPTHPCLPACHPTWRSCAPFDANRLSYLAGSYRAVPPEVPLEFLGRADAVGNASADELVSQACSRILSRK